MFRTSRLKGGSISALAAAIWTAGLALALAGCAGAATGPASRARWAPRPYAAEQIRDAMPAGTEIRYRLEAEGKPATVSHWTVTAADASGCTIHSKVLTKDGALLADQGKKTSPWNDLVKHATFPAEATVLTDASTMVPAGIFDTWLYEVRRSGSRVERFFFAKTLPGPPVLLLVLDGRRMVMRMALLSRK